MRLSQLARAAPTKAGVGRARLVRRVPVLLLCLLLPGFEAVRAVSAEPAEPVPDIPVDGSGPATTTVAPAPVPRLDRLENAGAVVGKVLFRIGDVFDLAEPAENRRIFRIVNRLHRKTREATLLRMLLFEPGDRVSRHRVDESARILRESRYLYDAEIEPLNYDGHEVDLMVKTRDVWTFAGGVNFSRKGGSNTTRFGVEEKNLFGWGKYLLLKRESNVDRASTLLGYSDPGVLGSHVVLDLRHSGNSDGQLNSVNVARPFYSLDTRWSTGLHLSSEDRTDALYTEGQVSRRFGHSLDRREAYAGFSPGLRDGRAHRFRFGFTYSRDRFLSLPDEAGGALPRDRTLAYPWIEFSSIQERYIATHDLNNLRRTEDLNLGREWLVRLGYSAPGFGADTAAGIVALSLAGGAAPGPRQMVLWSLHADSRYRQSRAENLRVGAGLRYHFRDGKRMALFVGLRGALATRPDTEEQLLLGGDSGLRGYPLRYATGDRSVLFTVEQRFYSDWHLFRVLRVGAAAFADVGAAWYHDGADRPLLRDVGLGLRLASSRSSHAALVHVDLALPLDGGKGIANLQVLVSSKETF